MKQVQQKLAIIFLSLLLTTNAHAWGSKRPTTPTPVPAPVIPPAPPVLPPTNPPVVIVPTGPYIDQIKDLAAASTCASYSWKNRGKAPAGYIKGMAVSFARGLCRLERSENKTSGLVGILSAARAATATKDALTHYQTNIASLAIQTNVAGTEPLRALYVLGIGLGMRESSGAYCEGWDKAAGSNRPSAAGEAGLFQTSLDSMGASPELSKLYNEYKSGTGRCMLEIFKQGASCSNTSNLGTGAGADYQAFNKACPAFATEYAMTMLRIQRAHYGPINRKEAEVIPACNQLLQKVQTLVENDPNACDDLI
jgi:uncharacterized protein YfiM (DUF2279 family)